MTDKLTVPDPADPVLVWLAHDGSTHQDERSAKAHTRHVLLVADYLATTKRTKAQATTAHSTLLGFLKWLEPRQTNPPD